jgi:hypothetical protein
MPTLVDLGYEDASDDFRHPFKKPAGGEPTKAQQTHNKAIRGIHGVGEHANSLPERPSRHCARSASNQPYQEDRHRSPRPAPT